MMYSTLSPPDRFENPHIITRPLCTKDTNSLFEDFLSDRHTTWHLPIPTHLAPAQSELYIRWCNAGWQAHLLYVFGLEDRKSGRLVGIFELRPALPRVEIGLITTKHKDIKRRLARAISTACLQICDWLISHPDVHRIYACCDATNIEAIRLARHLGLKFEATLANWEMRPNQKKAAAAIEVYTLIRPFTHFAPHLRTKLLGTALTTLPDKR